MIVVSNTLIANTRTKEQDPNMLGIRLGPTGAPSPVLTVAKDKKLPTDGFYYWNITQDISGGLFHVEVQGSNGIVYRLGVPVNPISKEICVVEIVGNTFSTTIFDYWAFPYATRMLNASALGIQPTEKCLSLDAGAYPTPMVYEFVSSVNQTWQYGSDLDSLKPTPFE